MLTVGTSMRSNPIDRWRHFRSDVDREITFLLTRYGEGAYQAAFTAAAKPNLPSLNSITGATPRPKPSSRP